ncbi:MAG: response regulator [Desulfobacula sp.]|nr:response regulator [Desulfobacula sp.]
MKTKMGYSLVIAMVLFSSLITLVTTALQLYVDYRVDIKRVNNHQALIRESYLKSITASAWLYDEQQIKTQLDGIANLPDMEHVSIHLDEGADWSVGSVASKRNQTQTFPLIYTHKGEDITIGKLAVVFSLDTIYTRLLRKAVTILAGNAVKIFFVSGFTLLIFQYLLTRHLYSLSNWLRSLDLGRSFEKFHLDRRPGKSKKTDELDEVVAAINDMQDKLKNNLSALIESEKKYRGIFENAVEGFFQSTPQGRFISVNPAFAKMLGYDSPQEVVDKIFDIASQYYADPKDRELYRQLLQTSGKVENFEFRARRKDGSEIWVSNSTRAHFDLEGKILRYEGFVQDISGRKQAAAEKEKLEAQLRQAQKMESLGTLAGGIAHDFNNILYPLIGFAEMLQEDLPQDSPEQSSITEVLSAAFRAKELVKQILAFSRKGDLVLQPVRLQSILEEALKLLTSSLPKTIDIQTQINADCGMVVADATQIHQVIMNLVTNAYHAMQTSGGTLTVVLEQTTVDAAPSGTVDVLPVPYAFLKIMDTGTGIPKEEMDKIFDPYFTTKETGKGTGLGLSVVQGIIKSCKGEIRIYSEAGKGTQVHVYLPIQEKTIAPMVPSAIEPIQVGAERILLVDDEEAIVKMAQKMLERLGYHVTSRTRSMEALEVFKADPDQFDVIITDMTMPDMTGIQLAREMKVIRANIPVIICTGFSDQINKENSRQMGIQGYLSKPVVQSELAKTIRDVLG